MAGQQRALHECQHACIPFADAESAMQVRAAGKSAILALPPSDSNSSASAATGNTSVASPEQRAAEAEVASANGVGHGVIEHTPLPQTVGVKRKRFENGK